MALGRYDEAAAAYDAADALAPGWETSHSGSCRADAWMCRHLARRRWRSEVLHALLLLCQESPQFIKDATKLAEVQKVLPEAPDCARLHLARAHALPGASRARDDAAVVAAYRAGLAACEADDVPPWGQDYVTRSWLLKGLSHYCADPAERLRLLREAASLDDRGSVIAAAGAWIELRKLGEEV